MAPLVQPWQAGQELAACLCLGAAAGALRSLAPPKGRGAILPDFLLVGLLLTLLQSYAAGYSAAGSLRWYMLAGGMTGAAAAQALLTPAAAFLFRLAALPLHALGWLWKQTGARAWAAFLAARAAKKAEKRRRKNEQNTLPKEQKLLYNSNV